jgi:hypothetical protein
MRLYAGAIADVFRDPFNLVLGIIATIGSAVVLGWAGQIVVRLPIGGLYWDLQPSRLAAIGAISLGFGIVLPLQLASLRHVRAAARARAGTGLAVSSLTGLAAVSCCSPLLVPALVGVVGASGTTALSVNLTVHRWFLPLSLVSIGLLALSGLLAARGLVRGCKVALAPDGAAGGRFDPGSGDRPGEKAHAGGGL